MAKAKKKYGTRERVTHEVIIECQAFDCFCVNIDPLLVNRGDKIKFTGDNGFVVFGEGVTEPPVGEIPETLFTVTAKPSKKKPNKKPISYFPIVCGGATELCEDCRERGPRPTMIVQAKDRKGKKNKKKDKKKKK